MTIKLNDAQSKIDGILPAGDHGSASTFRGVLEILGDISDSAYDKGSAFEQLVKTFLEVDKAQSLRFDRVWLWSEYPGRANRSDTGVDLVARERDGGAKVAIQCKFYSPDASIGLDEIDRFITAASTTEFASGILVSTTTRWSDNAIAALERRDDRPILRWGPEVFEQSSIDWSSFTLEGPTALKRRKTKELRNYQQQAVEDTLEGFKSNDRGKLIMACGSGKTFTALRIAEQLAGVGGNVLFLTPSISLLSQSLIDWSNDADLPLKTLAVCSDPRAGRRSTEDEDYSPFDLSEPASTDYQRLVDRYDRADRDKKMTVVFGTYQSIGVIHTAQGAGLPEFDLIICDEAHRTTGVKGTVLTGRDESGFQRVHDEDFIASRKRLYMTATPRIFSERAKRTASDNRMPVASMDNQDLYGPEFHRLGFGKAIDLDILSDYKVVIFDIDYEEVGADLDELLADGQSEVNMDNGARMVGCWNGLRKRGAVGMDWGSDYEPAKRAVAFSNTIDQSKLFAEWFPQVIERCIESDSAVTTGEPLRCDVIHVDGTQDALERSGHLAWLRDDHDGENCKVLTNARCLTEGIDVPALDAIIFLQPRKSEIDVVQAVGRVMRRSEGKDYGYIILPIARAAGATPQQTLSESSYNAVWQVINAIIAHDDRFEAKVNQIKLLLENTESSERKEYTESEDIGEAIRSEDADREDVRQMGLPFMISGTSEYRDAILARIVDKYSNAQYWKEWSDKIREIAIRHEARIRGLLKLPGSGVQEPFDEFLAGLRRNLNDDVDEEQAISMLSQHLVTKPVFDALFDEFAFSEMNQVSVAMQAMMDCLHNKGLEKETEGLEGLYRDVHIAANGIASLQDKQDLVAKLYESFLKKALPDEVLKSLGIVHTPTPIVDYIIRSVEDVLQQDFGASLADDGVRVLDPFVGTGTFITRLLQSGIIGRDRLIRKYGDDLHANELNLLAYYIASVNIEAAFHDITDQTDYQPFDGIVLTDTFQSYEPEIELDTALLAGNSERIEKQRGLDIRVVIGNPPWSATNNRPYPHIDGRVKETYAKPSATKHLSALYDPYVKAVRLASDRVQGSENGGIVAIVTNSGFIRGSAFDGFRKAVAKEFHSVYCYDLRGDARTSGEQRRKEGGNVFDGGTRAGVAVLILVKNPGEVPEPGAVIHYRDIGDYLTADAKLAIMGSSTLSMTQWSEIQPNRHGDWIGQRSPKFAAYRGMSKDADSPGLHMHPPAFASRTLGLVTSRDAWCYQSSRDKLETNVGLSIEHYNDALAEFHSTRREGNSNELAVVAKGVVSHDEQRFHWDDKNYRDIARGVCYSVDPAAFRVASYRPFFKQNVYLSRHLNNSIRDYPSIFPDASHSNQGIYVTGYGSTVPFSVLMSDCVIDSGYASGNGSSPCYFRWRYVEAEPWQASDAQMSWRRVSNINSECTYELNRHFLTKSIDDDDVFYYAYAILHSRQYREVHEDDLRKMPPRLPMAADLADFMLFVEAGRELARLHVGYETVEPFALRESYAEGWHPDAPGAFRVEKMSYVGKHRDPDKSRIEYNSGVTLEGIPAKAHEYVLGTRSAIDWLVERYRVSRHSGSGIVNDPNDWATEHGDPRYIINLIKRVTTVSVQTVDIVSRLPELPLD